MQALSLMQLIIASSGAATLLLLLLVRIDNSSGTPIRVPDLRNCDIVTASSPDHTQVLNCCLPLRGTISHFSFQNYAPLRTKVRGPAHRVNARYIEKYNRAYAAMRALPEDDPRSFTSQAKMHCALCSGAYKQRGQDVPLQVHFSWLFLPWHRWFLFFHERILGSLIGDPGFALLFWNWDNQLNGNTIPPFFSVNGSAVYDEYRNPDNFPPALVHLRIAPPLNISSRSSIIEENLNVLYQSIITASTADMFMGGAYSEGIDFTNVSVTNAPLGGALEQNAHGGIHFWTGDPRRELRGDMGVFTTASRDPIFYAHHSNVDRLWEVWKSLPGGRRTNPTHPDFLDAEFLFYDEHAKLVKVKVRDALDLNKLGITYKKVRKSDKLWINFNPEPLSWRSQVEYARAHGVQEVERACMDGPPRSSIPLGSKFTALVKRSFMRQEHDDGSELKEVLLIQGLNMRREAFIHLQVFINLPQANASTPIFSAEYVGSANIVPTPRASMKHLFTNVMLEIGDNVKRIGIEDEEWVVITLLVQSDSPHPTSVSIQGLQIFHH